MMNKYLLSAGILLALISITALAEQTPTSLSTDPRVKIVNYNADNVTLLKVHYGYTTDIVFDSNETVENVAVGDSLAWQSVPTANHLFIKPVAVSNTNMTVLTNQRSYNFQLESSNSDNPRDQIYELKFIYPDEDQTVSNYSQSSSPSQCNPTQCNWKYSFTGDKTIAPVQAFDDGKFTYFKFPSTGSSTMPAIFNVDKNRNETLVNYHMQDGYIVVNRVGKQFTLRDGNYVTCVYNDDAIGDWNNIK